MNCKYLFPNSLRQPCESSTLKEVTTHSYKNYHFRGKRKVVASTPGRHMVRCLGHYTDLERGSKKQDFRVLGSLEDKPNKSSTNMGRDDNKVTRDLMSPTVTIQFMSFLLSGIKSILAGALPAETNSQHPPPYNHGPYKEHVLRWRMTSEAYHRLAVLRSQTVPWRRSPGRETRSVCINHCSLFGISSPRTAPSPQPVEPLPLHVTCHPRQDASLTAN